MGRTLSDEEISQVLTWGWYQEYMAGSDFADYYEFESAWLTFVANEDPEYFKDVFCEKTDQSVPV